jgi:glycosyltransferase 2 family protein
LREVSLAEAWQTLLNARLDYIGLALVSIALNTLAKAVRWQVLLGRPGRGVSLHKVFAALLVGQMLNTLYPGRLGEFSRAYSIGRLGPGFTFTLGTVMLEKLLDLLSYALLFVILILLIPLPVWVSDPAYVLLFVVAAVPVIVYLVIARRALVMAVFRRIITRLPRLLRDRLVGGLESALASLDILQERPGLIRLALWSMVVWGTAVLTNHLALLALGLRLPFTASLLVLVVLQAGITLPSIPGRIGVFQLACILSLALFGVDQAHALSYGILLHALVLGPSTLLGLTYFAGMNFKFRQVRPVDLVETSSAD